MLYHNRHLGANRFDDYCLFHFPNVAEKNLLNKHITV
jgi:hypothetical protein